MITIKQDIDLANKVLRIGLGSTILWFGLSQVINPSNWIGYLQVWSFNLTFISTITLVYFNAFFEILTSLLLIFNQYTKFFSILLSLHMLVIIFHLGYNNIAVRDFGIMIGFLALIFISENKGILDKYLKR